MTDQPKPKAQSKSKRYFIVNPAGAVHEVTRGHARSRLAEVGYRMATAAEVAAYKKAPAHRGLGPVAVAWSPEPDVEVEVE
ncbi:MAG: hypothetical protein DRI81_16270 [Chloroflexi bacterium]|nr:MAG: hypothetical protein DRI81_16270 [Chloroflexota bacterium]